MNLSDPKFPARAGETPTPQPRHSHTPSRPSGAVLEALKIIHQAQRDWAQYLDRLRPTFERVGFVEVLDDQNNPVLDLNGNAVLQPTGTVKTREAERRQLLEAARFPFFEPANAASKLLAEAQKDFTGWRARIRQRAFALVPPDPDVPMYGPGIDVQLNGFFSLPPDEQREALYSMVDRDDPRERELILTILDLPPALREAKAPKLNPALLTKVEERFLGNRLRADKEEGALDALQTAERHARAAHSRLNELDTALFRGMPVPDLTPGRFGTFDALAGSTALSASTTELNLETEV